MAIGNYSLIETYLSASNYQNSLILNLPCQYQGATTLNCRELVVAHFVRFGEIENSLRRNLAFSDEAVDKASTVQETHQRVGTSLNEA